MDIDTTTPDRFAKLTWAWTMPPQRSRRATVGLLTLPFDAARDQYGAAVELGLVRRSMLAGAAFEQALGALERLALGAWARRV